MTIGFMGLFVALLGEYIGNRLATVLLVPAVVLGLATVLYWHWTDDLRPYYWIQLIPLLTIPAVMILFRSGYSHHWLLLVALGCYVLAKVTESYDLAIYRNTQEFVSGHSIKHLLAAAGSYSVLLYVAKKESGGVVEVGGQHTRQRIPYSLNVRWSGRRKPTRRYPDAALTPPLNANVRPQVRHRTTRPAMIEGDDSTPTPVQ